MSRHEKDLFGNPLPVPAHLLKSGRCRKIGYAARPGTGPKRQRCHTCAHHQRVLHKGDVAFKCELMTHLWTHSAETDINLRAPACKEWQRRAYAKIR